MAAFVLGTALVVGRAEAVVQYGDAQIAGFLYSQGAFQHDGLDRWELAQVRNLLNLNFEYQLAKRGRLIDRWDVPFVRSAQFYLQYRGAYDPVFALRSRYRDILENRIRKQVESDNEIRDLYLDVALRDLLPGRLSLRIGRQQVVWGEADVVRSLDVINPLDLRDNFLLGPDQPNLNEYRVPLWMLKVLYGFGQVGPVANNAVELLWIPGDIIPLRGLAGEAIGLPFNQRRRPSALPHRRVRHPFEITRIGPGFTEVPAQAFLPQVPLLCADPEGCKADLVWFNHSEPRVGEEPNVLPPKNEVPSRSWIHNAEVGARWIGQVSPFGQTIDFSLNYFYTFSDIPAAFADFPAVRNAIFGDPQNGQPPTTVPGTRDPDTGAGLTFEQFRNIGSDNLTIWIPAALWYPRTHVFGGTLTYSDNDLTGAIWRVEASHQTRDPRIRPRPPFVGDRKGEFTFEDFEQTFRETGRTTRMMLGADLFRSFPWLDPIVGAGQPFFVSGQAFVEYKEDVSNTIGTLLDVNDRQRRWNPLYTLLVQYFFRGGQWVPLLVLLYDQDPQHFALAPFVEYHPRNWLTIKVGQIWFLGSKFRQSSRFLHPFADRDETFLRLQYDF